jgi:hypothetical protein
MRTLAMAVGCGVLMAQAAGAICVVMPLEHHLSNPKVTAVFSGTVQDVSFAPAGQTATFQVSRVWKGRVGRRTVLYNGNSLMMQDERIELQSGRTYLVIAHRQSPDERAAFHVPSASRDALGVSGCDLYLFDSQYARDVLGDAPGYPPR